MSELWKCHDCNNLHGSKDEMHTVEHKDPYATGDSWHVHIEYQCAACNSENVVSTFMCEACGQNEPMDGWDHCADCVIEGKHPHTADYDATDLADARKWKQEQAA